MGQESVCAAYAAGTLPTDAPKQSYAMQIALTVDTNVTTVQSVYTQMDTVLQTRIAPLLLNCVDNRRRRRTMRTWLLHRQRRGRRERLLQTDNATEYVNVVFDNVIQNTQRKYRYSHCAVEYQFSFWTFDSHGLLTRTTENCSSSTAAANVECVPSIIGTNLYYYGDEPTTFGEQLRQAILIWNFDINGLLGFGEVQVEEVASPEPAVNEPDNNSTTSNNTSTNTTTEPPPAASVSSPTPGPRTRASPPSGTVSGIQNNESRDRSVNPGAFVAAAVAALTLMLVAVFVAKRQRDRSTDSISKHREFHDDEDNDSDLGNETDDNTAVTPIPAMTPQSPPPQQRLAYIVGDDESWNTGRSSAMGQEILASSALTELLQHGPHVTCSSPNCEVCELKRQMGTKFVASSAAMDSPPREELPPRRYEAEDTVSL
jgi:hypothetical protein